jgi:dihydroorotate dehydrogenase
MYKLILRPILFLFDPEKVHYFVFSMIRFMTAIPGVSWLNRKLFLVADKRLERTFFGLTFKNPVGIAAGFDKNAVLYNQLESYGFGFLEVGTATPKPQIGNPKKRLFRLKKDQALINRMGFNNWGAVAIAQNLRARTTSLIVGGNIGKNTETPNDEALQDYVFNFDTLHDVVDYFVVNVSCPNVKDLTKLQDTDFLLELLHTLKDSNAKKKSPKPILLKIAPDLNNSQLDEIIEIVAQTKIDGVIATNTTTSRENLITSPEEIQSIGNGGLSGKPLTKRSTDVIRYLSEKSNKAFPIIGVGGIHSVEDALEKLAAGADLLQVYTGFIYEGPKLVRDINRAILNKCNS